ncbi:hypothetical protein ElyMa_007009800 [Elysia marginata]|uniref:Uncharacterized protein n=1 Tax=Elysia marginata TaxID=1093978 RepID=A0AAV4JQW0_9GAST|nr:hypothetical protein ElyMa_007009800 [Elysia marginata]
MTRESLGNHPLKSPLTFLDLVKTDHVLDTARVMVLDSDHLNRYRISVWGQRNTRFILSIVRRCADEDYDDDLAFPTLPTDLPSGVLIERAGAYHQNTLPRSYNGMPLPDSTNLSQTYDSFDHDIKQSSAPRAPRQTNKIFAVQPMTSLQPPRSRQESYQNTQNSPRTLSSDDSTVQIANSSLRMQLAQHLPRERDRWPSQKTRARVSMFTAMPTFPSKLRTEEDSVPATKPLFSEHSTMRASIHHNPAIDTLVGNSIDASAQDDSISQEKTEDGDHSFMLSNKTVLSSHDYRRDLKEVHKSKNVRTAGNGRRSISVVKPNLINVTNENYKLNYRRNVNDSVTASFPYAKQPFGVQNIIGLDKAKNRFKSLAEKHDTFTKPTINTVKIFYRHLTTQSALFPSQSPQTRHDKNLASRKRKALIPVVSNLRAARFYSTEPLKMDKALTAQAEANTLNLNVKMFSTGSTPQLLQPTLSSIQAAEYSWNTDEIQLLQVVNNVHFTSMTGNGPTKDTNGFGLLSSIQHAVNVEETKTFSSQRFDPRVSEPAFNPHDIQASETFSSPIESDLPTERLASSSVQHVEETQSSNSVDTLWDDFLASEPFVYTPDNHHVLTSSTLYPTPLEVNGRTTLNSNLVIDTKVPGFEIRPSPATVFSESSYKSNKDLPGGFLESEPFHFTSNEKSVHVGYDSLPFETPIPSTDTFMLDASLGIPGKSVSIVYKSTPLPLSLLSVVSVSTVPSVFATSFQPSITKHTLIQPSSVMQSQTVLVTSGGNSSEGEGYSENQNEGTERDTFWPVVAALVVGIPSVIVFGIAITVFHRRRTPDPQKLFNMQTLRSANVDISDTDVANTNFETPMRNSVS